MWHLPHFSNNLKCFLFNVILVISQKLRGEVSPATRRFMKVAFSVKYLSFCTIFINNFYLFMFASIKVAETYCFISCLVCKFQITLWSPKLFKPFKEAHKLLNWKARRSQKAWHVLFNFFKNLLDCSHYTWHCIIKTMHYVLFLVESVSIVSVSEAATQRCS